jgi:hypothetical protein
MSKDPGGPISKIVIAVLVLVALSAAVAWFTRKGAPVETVAVEPPVRVDNSREPQPPVVRFTDITAQAGIDFVHRSGATGDRLLPETMGGGGAFFDLDNDGDQDLLLIDSGQLPGQSVSTHVESGLRLYRNDGSGHFADISASAITLDDFYGMGVALGDYDQDGWTDVFVTAVGENRLYRNLGGRLEDVTATAGVAGKKSDWGTGASFVDVDQDGDLDLFVANYVRWSPDIDRKVNFQITGIGRAYGPPTAFAGSDAYLYRNLGDGRFEDVSDGSGIRVAHPQSGEPMAKALAVLPLDIDGDGAVDLFVANDTVQNFLFHNLGGGRFEEVGTDYGVAYDRNGAATGAMGVDAAQVFDDGEQAIVIGNFANEMSSLYLTSAGRAPLSDQAIIAGIGPASRKALTFGLFFFDYDLDGRLDLLQANGHLEPEINQVQASQSHAQPPQLFWNCGDACRTPFVPVGAESMGDLALPMVGRGAAYADIDDDGDLDVLLTQNDGAPRLLRNDQSLGHHWLRVVLRGTPPNREAIGAELVLTLGDRQLRRRVMPSRSYLSQVELPVTFGLGDETRADRLLIVWPDGSRQELADLEVDRTLVVSARQEHE